MDFMINSGLMTDMAAIPVPAFAVPYAAPRAENMMAEAAPITPKNGEYIGAPSSELIVARFVGVSCRSESNAGVFTGLPIGARIVTERKTIFTSLTSLN